MGRRARCPSLALGSQLRGQEPRLRSVPHTAGCSLRRSCHAARPSALSLPGCASVRNPHGILTKSRVLLWWPRQGRVALTRPRGLSPSPADTDTPPDSHPHDEQDQSNRDVLTFNCKLNGGGQKIEPQPKLLRHKNQPLHRLQRRYHGM